MFFAWSGRLEVGSSTYHRPEPRKTPSPDRMPYLLPYLLLSEHSGLGRSLDDGRDFRVLELDGLSQRRLTPPERKGGGGFIYS